MRKYICGLAALLIGGLAASAGRVELSRDGKALLAIATPQQPTPAERRAAENLAYWLQRITGAEFPVAAGDDTQPHIGIGRLLPADAGAKVSIVPRDGSLYLGGDPELAVWTFLEEELGCRWFTPERERIPAEPDLTIEVTERQVTPDFAMRFVYTDYALCASPEWTERNRVMRWNHFNHIDGWFCHTYENICGMEEIAEHPELFARAANGDVINTQLCPTHPEIRRRAVERASAALRANRNPEAYLLSITENDGSTGYCQCERCLAVIRKHGGAPIAAHLTLVNEVARAVRDEFPEIKVEFLVYSRDFRAAPTGMTLEPNVALWYCATDFSKRGMATPFAADPAGTENFRQWRALADEVNVWEYNCDYSNYFRVTPTLPARLDNLGYWRDHDVNGIFALEVFGRKGGDQQNLRAWVMAKMMWDASLEPDALAQEFCAGVYGAAADARFRYYELVRDAGDAHQTIEEFYGVEAFYRRAAALFGEAFAAAAADPAALRQLELDYLPVAMMELERIFATGSTDGAPHYDDLLAFVRRVAAREKVDNYSEIRSMSGRLAELELLRNAGDGVLRIHAIDGKLYEYPGVDDPLSDTGRATRLPCTGNWLVQWPIPVNLCRPGVKYRLRVEVRAGVKSDAAHAATIGVHAETEESRSFQARPAAAQLPFGQYGWLEIGEAFIPQAGDYVWFAAEPGSGIEWLYVDRMELVPVE